MLGTSPGWLGRDGSRVGAGFGLSLSGFPGRGYAVFERQYELVLLRELVDSVPLEYWLPLWTSGQSHSRSSVF